MSDAEAEGRPTEFYVVVPLELEGGAYANFLHMWHTAHEFTLDFAAIQPPEIDDPADPHSPALVPCRVVSRVKIPATFIFDVIRAINDEMTLYEQTFGEIRRPHEHGGD